MKKICLLIIAATIGLGNVAFADGPSKVGGQKVEVKEKAEKKATLEKSISSQDNKDKKELSPKEKALLEKQENALKGNSAPQKKAPAPKRDTSKQKINSEKK